VPSGNISIVVNSFSGDKKGLSYAIVSRCLYRGCWIKNFVW